METLYISLFSFPVAVRSGVLATQPIREWLTYHSLASLVSRPEQAVLRLHRLPISVYLNSQDCRNFKFSYILFLSRLFGLSTKDPSILIFLTSL
jgi:hypothetical protein